MTKAHTYSHGTDSAGRRYYRIDGKPVSQDRFDDSFDRSNRALSQQRQGRFEEAGRFRKGQFVGAGGIIEEPEAERIPHALIVTRERVRGTRIAVLVNHLLPMSVSEAESYLDGQYDRGGNYVLEYRSARTKYYREPQEEIEEELGADGSADVS